MSLILDGTNGVTTPTGTGGVSVGDDLIFTGTGNRITGDFSNATIANRVAFQTSTVNATTSLAVIPNGTGTNSNITLYGGTGGSDVNNSSSLFVGVSGGETTVRSNASGTGSYLPMTFYTGGSERVRIDTSGNVGIGTSSPATKLDVSGPASVTSFTGTTKLGFTTRGSTGATDYSGIDFIGNNQVNPVARIAVLSGAAGTSLQFGTSNNYASGITNPAMAIDARGNVGIGTSSPSYPLEIQADAAAFGWSIRGRALDGISVGRFANNANTESVRLVAFSNGEFAISNTSSVTERMRINSAGNVGIGLSSPATKLDVDGQISGKFSDVGTNTAAQDLAANHVSQVTISAATTLTTTVPPAGTQAIVIIVTSGTTSRTVTFGTGFKATGTLATGTAASRRFVVSFVSDGTQLLECSRTAAITV
jgi:hypothetical protein